MIGRNSGKIPISIITLFFDMISGISRQMVEQKFSNLKHSSSSCAMISMRTPNGFGQCIYFNN